MIKNKLFIYSSLSLFTFIGGITTPAKESPPVRQPLPSSAEISKLPPDGGAEFNRLIHETSPYLRQHARNPVDWYPWGEEAFERARKEDKPIFLSVGYSSCHWCHVMEHESFENESVAKILNQGYICVKVDREERPDIDRIYMNATQLMNGQGGWPNSVFLDHEQRPWFCGTYFPPEDRQGRAGFKTVLARLHQAWTQDREQVEEQGKRLADALGQVRGRSPGDANSADLWNTPRILKQAASAFRQDFDAQHGGFGGAPKFPPHGALEVLLLPALAGEEDVPEMALKTLDAMALGGIRDHIGGGFHRYATDGVWFLPHFEKMLYDNGQLAVSYARAYQLSGEARYAEALRGICDWVLKDMADPAGGFHSAWDADSEGVEGKYYLWTLKELEAILGREEAARFAHIYPASQRGNYYEEATRTFTGTNHLHLKSALEEVELEKGETRESLLTELSQARDQLNKARDQRVPPQRDDKVLSAWNGLMIAGLAEAGRALKEPRYTQAAEKAADFILNKMRDDSGGLLRSYRAGRAAIPAYLDDYAAVAWGLLTLHDCSGSAERLRQARELADRMIKDFRDPAGGGLFYTASHHETLLTRDKEPFDNATPAANGLAARVLVRLANLTGEAKYSTEARNNIEPWLHLVHRAPRATPSLILALADLEPAASKEAVLRVKPVSIKIEARDEGLRLTLTIDEGWHINSHTPGVEFLIPTAIEGAEAIYPKGEEFKVPGFDEVSQVYSGCVTITVKKIPEGPDDKLRLTFQACSEDGSCLPPETVEIPLP